MKHSAYEAPRCQVYRIDDEAPLMASKFDYVDEQGFIQVVCGEGVKPDDAI